MLEKALYQVTRSQTCLAYIYTDVIINNVRTSPNVSKWFHNELDKEGNCGEHLDLYRIIFTSMFTLVIASPVNSLLQNTVNSFEMGQRQNTLQTGAN